MKRMLLLSVFTLTLCLAGLGAVGHASAVDPLDEVCKKNPTSTVCKENQSSASNDANPLFGPKGIITKILGWLVRIVGIAAVIGIIVAGIMMTFAGGDANQAASARSTITFSLIGLGIAAMAQVMVSFVISKL